jgi:DNA-binding response OmpR family regulator
MPITKTTIVIADDDVLVRNAYKALLERQGHEVLVAGDGNRALALLETHAVDIVLLDILMPDKEGIETLLEIKRSFPETVVYVMTGGTTKNGPDFLHIATKFGADGVLKKPFQPQALLKLINGSKPDAQRSANS